MSAPPPPQEPRRQSRVGGVARYLFARLRMAERGVVARFRGNKWLSPFFHSGLFSLKSGPVCRGLAIGLFWAFIPMPFQMAPATLFCMLSHANLPLAIVMVWISNPLTYAPILYLEYMLGYWLFADGAPLLAFAEFSAQTANGLGGRLANVVWLMLKGALVLSLAAMAAGYLLGFPLSAYLLRQAERARRIRQIRQGKKLGGRQAGERPQEGGQ